MSGLCSISAWLLGAVLTLAPHAAFAQEVWDDVWILLGAVRSLGPVDLSVTGFVLGDLELRGGMVEARARVMPSLSMAPAFMVTHRQTAEGRVREHRARLDLTAHGSVGRVQVAGRTLLERRWYRTVRSDARSSREASTVLRARLRTDLTARRRPPVTPFATVEQFYDLRAGRGTRTWISAGLSAEVGNLRLEPSYLRRFERDGPDGDAIALSAMLRL